jgi:hypothetical protein
MLMHRNSVIRGSRFVDALKTRFQAMNRSKKKQSRSPGNKFVDTLNTHFHATKRSKKSNAALGGSRLMITKGFSGYETLKKSNAVIR